MRLYVFYACKKIILLILKSCQKKIKILSKIQNHVETWHVVFGAVEKLFLEIENNVVFLQKFLHQWQKN